MHARLYLLFFLLPVSHTFFFNYQDFGIGFLQRYALKILEKSGGKTKCAYQLRAFVNDLIEKKTWALEMFDASAKPQTGLLRGNIWQMGSYDQCLAVSTNYNGTNIKGKYCTISLAPSENNSDIALTADKLLKKYYKKHYIKKFEENLKKFNVTWGVCIPAACNTKRLQKIWNHTENFYNTGVHLYFDESMCSVRDKAITRTTGDYLAYAFFGGILLLMLLSTIYDIRNKKKPKGQKSELLASFSVYTNGLKLFSLKNSDNKRLHCINGLRVLSLVWIIFSHRFTANAFLPLTNTISLFEAKDSPLSELILGTTSAVDTFFAISGILVVYLYLSITERIKFNLLAYYIHRFVRLTPALFGLLVMYTYIAKLLGSGPIWSKYEAVQASCEKNWLNTLLFIQNYYDLENVCIGQAWYLAVDTQLYFLAPIFLPFLARHPKKTICALLGVVLASSVYTFWLTWTKELGAIIIHASPDYFYRIYGATEARLGPWVMGAIFGYFIFETRKKSFRINRHLVRLLWVASLLVMYQIVYVQADLIRKDYDKLTSAFFNGFARTLWGLCVCWVIFACTNNCGGLINDFLSLPIFTVLARLSYPMALLHMPVMGILCLQERHPRYYSFLHWVHDFCGDFIMSLAASVVWSLAFESPTKVLERALLRKEKKNTKKVD